MMGAESELECLRFIVTPNPSMSWRANKLFIASLAVLSFGMGGAFAVQGYWMILPFVGFEIALLSFVLYWCCWQSMRREVISIDADNVEIELGRNSAQELHRFQSAWTKVIFYPPRSATRHGRLVMQSKGQEIEVGAFLTDTERESLAVSIQDALTSASRPNCFT